MNVLKVGVDGEKDKKWAQCSSTLRSLGLGEMGTKRKLTKETKKKQPMKWPGDLVWCPGRPVKEEYQEGASDSSLP